MTQTTTQRWQALDILRGLMILFMLLNLNPGAWEHQFDWLVHAKWQGGHFIDLIAPTFLFCIGAAIPLSLSSRIIKGDSTTALTRHILIRGLLLVLIGLFLNAYPGFDVAHLRIPGVLQRIGVSYAAVALFVLYTAKRSGGFKARPAAITAAITVILLSWFVLLYFVPVPGFGAPRFDPIGSWPAFFDRTVLTTDHMFVWWPVDGKIVFDPDGLLSTFPVCANVLAGALVGHLYMTKALKQPNLMYAATGTSLMLLAILLNGVCPIIKNIWTSTFVLFTVGFSLLSLAALTVVIDNLKAAPLFFPAKVYGANALLAYMMSFLIAPLIDAAILPQPAYNLRHAGYVIFAQRFAPNLASFGFGLLMLTLFFIPLYICYRKRWFLKL